MSRTWWHHKGSCKTFLKITSIVLKLFQKIEKEGTLLNLFYQVTFTLTSVLEKRQKENKSTEKKITVYFLWIWLKIFQQNISRQNSTIYKNYYKWLSSTIFPEMQGLKIHKSIHGIYHILKKEGLTHDYVNRCRKSIDKV